MNFSGYYQNPENDLGGIAIDAEQMRENGHPRFVVSDLELEALCSGLALGGSDRSHRRKTSSESRS